MPWPGDANLHVSIVNWLKGSDPDAKRLFIQEGVHGKATERVAELDRIGPSLSFSLDVTAARPIAANQARGCYQGQTPGHKAFLLKEAEAKPLLSMSNEVQEVLRPYLIANDLLGKKGRPSRYVIDFGSADLLTAQAHGALYKRLESKVLPARQAAAEKEAKRNAAALAKNPKRKGNRHHDNFLKKWWLMSYSRDDLQSQLAALPRYIVCGRVTKRPIFAFIDSAVTPSDALQVFAYSDDYSFGVLQSSIHWEWFTNRCSTLTERFRYTSNTVWDSFPWPQDPTRNAVRKVAAAAVDLRKMRSELASKHQKSLRELYRSMELPGVHPLKAAHTKLDAAVREAYGMTPKQHVLPFLLQLNNYLADREDVGEEVQGPGLPTFIKEDFVTPDAIT